MGILCTQVYVIFRLVLSITEISLGSDTRKYMDGLTGLLVLYTGPNWLKTELALECLNYLVLADSISQNTRMPTGWKRWSQLLLAFRPRPTCPGVLYVDDDQLELAPLVSSSAAQQFAREVPRELTEHVLGWWQASEDFITKALWITTDSKKQCSVIAQTVADLLSPGDDESRIGVALVDVSEARSSFWLLIRGFVMASPEYRGDILNHLPSSLTSFRIHRLRNLVRRRQQEDISSLYLKDISVRFHVSALCVFIIFNRALPTN
jgi:hypothetical protein